MERLKSEFIKKLNDFLLKIFDVRIHSIVEVKIDLILYLFRRKASS